MIATIAELVGIEIGQLAFETFDIQSQSLAPAEHQDRAAAARFGRVELDSEPPPARLSKLNR